MKTKLSTFVFGLLTMLVLILTGCSNDVENIIVIPGYNGGQEYVEKKGSNFILNVGDSNYGTSSYGTQTQKTRASVETNAITANAETPLKDVIVGVNYSTNLWDQYTTSSSDVKVAVGSSEGYCYAKADMTSPYGNEWKSDHSISDGHLTIKSIQGENGFASPVPVEFWGRHSLDVNDSQKSTYTEGTREDGWTEGPVKKTTNTVAISKNIQYANSAVKINLQLGVKRVLGWYDKYPQATNPDGTPSAIKGVEITKDNIDGYPTGNGKTTIDGVEYERYVSGGRNIGTYYHEQLGYTIAIKQKGGTKSWHFIGENAFDDINFDVQEVRIESSDSCVYGKDYAYSPSDSIAKYSYDFGTSHLKSGEHATLTVMPTKAKSSAVILHCKITKFPTQQGKNFVWYIDKTYDDETLVAVKDNTEFYILGKISTIDGKSPTGSPYSITWNGGIYCPDVVTTVNVVIDDLCVKGAVVTDPDGANASNILWNYDWEYGTMDGQWTIGK